MAITQFMVETLVVIIVALVLARLPRLTAFARPNGERWYATALFPSSFRRCGHGCDAAVIDLPIPLDLSEYFAAKSYTEVELQCDFVVLMTRWKIFYFFLRRGSEIDKPKEDI